MTPAATTRGWVARVRLFVRTADDLRCELCGAQLLADHPHLFEIAKRQLRCCCRACALLFGSQQNARYRSVPRDARYLDSFSISDAQWDALAIPIDIAFFFHDSSVQHIVALYPGPAGGTQSLLELQAWAELVAGNPWLAQLEPDVEALLVNRSEGAREYYRVPIDQCYALTGVIRARWRGVSGGRQAWDSIHRFFAALKIHGRSPEDLLHA